jgi:mono/diheme cytochrome c family protein
MRGLVRALFATILVFGAGTAALAQTSPAPPGDAKAGAVLFMRYGCYECHNIQGQGNGKPGNGNSNVGPKLAPRPIPWTPFVAQVRHPRDIMPAFAPQIVSDADLAAIYAYLVAQPPVKPVASIPLLNGVRRESSK